jgi:hypothetical protein
VIIYALTSEVATFNVPNGVVISKKRPVDFCFASHFLYLRMDSNDLTRDKNILSGRIARSILTIGFRRIDSFVFIRISAVSELRE